MAHHARAVSANRIFALAGALLTLVFVLMVSRVFDTPTQKALPSEVRVVPAYETARAATTLDTDSDGMPDWEETLLGTDPNNADENGNGVMDGEERSELVARLVQTSSVGVFSASTSDELHASSLTDVVAQNLMGNVMQSVQQGKKMSEADVQGILANSVDAMSEVAALPLYTKEDVVVIPPSQEARITYLETVRVDLLNALEQKPNEYNALNYLVQGRHEEGVQDLTQAVAIYEKAAAALRKVPVPEDAVETHVMLVSGLLEYADSLKKIAQFKNDPILATIGLNAFGLGQSKFAAAMNVYMQYTEKLKGGTGTERGAATD